MDREYYYVACPGVLGVRTNVKDFRWSYGATMPLAARPQFDECAVRIRVEVTDDVQLPPSDRLGKYHYWLGREGEDALFYDRPFCFGARLQIAAKGLLGDEPCVKVNRTYYRYVSHRFMNLHSIGYILTDVASMLLLRKGFAPLHCSAFKYGDATVVVAAAPNTGKTLTSMTACMDHGAAYIAEDLAITDGRDVFAAPWTSTFRYYKQIDRSFRALLRNKATQLLPPIELWSASRPKPITEYISADRVTAQSRVTHVVLLERGDEHVRAVDVDEAYRKMRNLNRYEFNYHKAPLIIAYEYFNPQWNIDSAYRTEEESIRRLLRESNHVWVVRSENPTRYADMLIEAIGRHARGSTLDCEAA